MASIGKPIDRVDGHLKVTGRAKYAAEFSLPDAVHAVLVQSTIGAGEVVGFDLDKAKAMPGVLAIITADNALKLGQKGGTQQTVHPPLLQDMRVHYNGQHIAVVVADTLDRAAAAAAAAVVRVRYRQNEPVTSMDAVLGQAYPPKNFRNGERSPDSNRGDPDGAFAGAPIKVEATYTTPIEHHNPMEKHATIARWHGDQANAADYLMPVNADVPDIQAVLVPNDERTSNPLGAKGIGELPMVGVAAAVANAVYHATGVRVRDLPIRVEHLV